MSKSKDRPVTRAEADVAIIVYPPSAAQMAVLNTRHMCMVCGTKLSNDASRAAAVCTACRKYCPCCGRQTTRLGHYGVCVPCVGRVENAIARARKQKPIGPEETLAPDAECECGEPAEVISKGKPRCLDCAAELANTGEGE